MLELFYHIKSHKNKSLIVEIVEGHAGKKGASRKLYTSSLNEVATEKEKKVLSTLIQLHRKNNPQQSVETLSFNEIELPLKSTFEILLELAKTNKLYFKQKPLQCSLGDSVEFVFHLEEQMDQNTVQAKLIDGQRSFYLNECDEIYPSNPLFIIYENRVRTIKNSIDYKWIDKFYSPVTLSKKQTDRFIEDLDEEDPKIIRVCQKKVEGTPCLILKDVRGIFSELWIDFGLLGKFNSLESSKGVEYEKDLLELGWIKKGETYYCPLEKIEENMILLIELGWKILAPGDKIVSISKDLDLHFSLSEDQIEAEGTLSFNEDKIAIPTLLGALEKEQTFISLSTTKVALIDRKWLKEKIGTLSQFSSIENNRAVLSKNQFALLSSFNKEEFRFEDRLVEFLNKTESRGFKALTLSTQFIGKLHPYQEVGLSWLNFLYENGFSGILSDEMGLGKTVQVLAFFAHLRTILPILIVVPTTLIYNWQKEFNRFLPKTKVYIHSGSTRIKEITLLEKESYIITSYATLRNDSALLSKITFECIVLDEATAIKNSNAQISKQLSLFSSKFRLCISATPMENRAEELWALFDFLMPSFLKNKKDFERKILEGRSDVGILTGLKNQIRPFMLRRLKKDVEIQLPPKIEQDVFLEMTEEQKEIYENFFSKNKEELHSKSKLDILNIILRLRQICCHPHLVDSSIDPSYEKSAKLTFLFEDLEQVLNENHKVLIYSQFTSFLTLVEKEVIKRGYNYLYLDGKIPAQERQKRVVAFESDPNISLFLISLKAGGVGLNLTSADYVYLLDPWWNEAVEAQAIDRCHRIGQEKKVIAKRLYTTSSIEEKIMLLKQEKASDFQRLIDSEEEFPIQKKDDLLRLLI